MNAESIRVMRTEAWTDWEGYLVNGTFPLHRCLGSSNHGAAFLTEHKARQLREATIKLVPADHSHSETQQLLQWGSVLRLQHPQLVRMFDVGRCQLGGREFVFALMEYAEQTLAELLPKRPLSAAEVREMLPAVLAGLTFLHRNNLAHGQVKPANIMVVNDRLKLSSDTARSPGHPVGGVTRSYLYDPPELMTTGTSSAGDVWALGVTLVEALTQRYPAPDERSQSPLLPAGVPEEFLDTVRRCLSRVPAERPTLVELDARYQSVPAAPVLPPAAEIPEEPSAPVVREASPEGRHWITTIAVVLLLACAGWLMWRFFFLENSNSARVPAQESRVESVTGAERQPTGSSPAPAASAPAGHESTAAAATDVPASAPAVVYGSVPDIAPSILRKIRGQVVVRVRVLVDPAGDVVGQFMENAGPSRFFARRSADAAGAWKFIPSQGRGPRVWLLRFAFDRSGATVESTPAD